MAPPKKPWLRWYVEAIWDRKLRRQTPATRWLFVALLSCARSSPLPGHLLLTDSTPMTEEDMADAAALKSQDVEKGIQSLATIGLIDVDTKLDAWFIPKWNERQFESDTSTDRTAKRRSIDVASHDDVTPPENRVRRQITETDRKPPAPQGAKETEPRPRDPVWDALVAAFGTAPATKTERGSWNKAAKELREVGATPEQIRVRTGEFKARFSGAVCTPMALIKHWGALGTQASRYAGPSDQTPVQSEKDPACEHSDPICADCRAENLARLQSMRAEIGEPV